MQFAKEELFPFWEQVQPLFKLHYEEIAQAKHLIKLEPREDVYKKLFDYGLLEIHTARDNGVLVGYSVFIVEPHLHYKSSLTAMNDLLYLAPSHRKGWTAYKFLKFSIAELGKRNPQRIMWHMKPHQDFSALIKRLGGKMFEHVYSMVLEG